MQIILWTVIRYLINRNKHAYIYIHSILNMGLVLISSLFALIFIFQNTFKMQTNCIETVHKARHDTLV